ncbi:MAG: TetR family transcriptional regulator [Pseudomonadales bacterium]|nr:TetR family transcriptional regulator [Pseudomonadales bacterium]
MNNQLIKKKKYESKRQVARQETILTVARDMLAEVGYEKTTIRGLAERARVAPGTLYNLYNSKDELIVAAVQELLTELSIAAETESRPGVDRLFAISDQTSMAIQENPAYAEAVTKAMFGPGEHEGLNNVLFRRYAPFMEAELRQAVSIGDLRGDTPISILASHLQSQSWGIVVAWMMGTIATDALVVEGRRSRAMTLLAYAQGACRDKLNSMCVEGGSTRAI